MPGQRRHLVPGILPTQSAALAHIAHHLGIGAHCRIGLKIFGPKEPKAQPRGLEFGQQLCCPPVLVVLPNDMRLTRGGDTATGRIAQILSRPPTSTTAG